MMHISKSKQGKPRTGDQQAEFRLNISVTADLIDFLHKVAMESKAKGGRKLYKTTIIRAFIHAIRDLDESGKLDLSGVRDVGSLKGRIVDAFHSRK